MMRFVWERGYGMWLHVYKPPCLPSACTCSQCGDWLQEACSQGCCGNEEIVPAALSEEQQWWWPWGVGIFTVLCGSVVWASSQHASLCLSIKQPVSLHLLSLIEKPVLRPFSVRPHTALWERQHAVCLELCKTMCEWVQMEIDWLLLNTRKLLTIAFQGDFVYVRMNKNCIASDLCSTLQWALCIPS